MPKEKLAWLTFSTVTEKSRSHTYGSGGDGGITGGRGLGDDGVRNRDLVLALLKANRSSGLHIAIRLGRMYIHVLP